MSLSSKIKKVRGTYVEPAKPVYNYKPVVKPDKNDDPSFKNTESFGRIPTPTIKSLPIKAPVVPVVVNKITRDKGTPSLKESVQKGNAKQASVDAKIEKKVRADSKDLSETLKQQIIDKYGIDPEKNAPEYNFESKMKLKSRGLEAEFQKEYDKYIVAKGRSNPGKEARLAGFDFSATELEKAEGKETVESVKGYGVNKFLGSAVQQAALYATGGKFVEGVVGKLLPKASPFVAETIKDVAIGTGTQLAEAPVDKPTAGQFGANVAIDIALNALFGAVGKGLSKLDLSNLKTAKPSQVVGEVAEKLNVSIVEADKAIDDAIDFYVNQSGVADTKLFEQLQLEAPKTKDLSDVSNTLSSKLRAKQSDLYVNQFGVADKKPFEQLQLEAPKNVNSDASVIRLREGIQPQYKGADFKGDMSLTQRKLPLADLGNQKIKAFQHDNPEVKPFYKEKAEELLLDATYAKRATRKGTLVRDEEGEVVNRFGDPRATTPQMARILDETGYGYEDIKKALNEIIEDNGKENNALSKKIEPIIDDMLVDGYVNIVGEDIKPNIRYIQTRNRLDPTKINIPQLERPQASQLNNQLSIGGLDANGQKNLFDTDMQRTDFDDFLDFDTRKPASRLSEKVKAAQSSTNKGYHAGDLGKAEHFGRQVGSNRGTGHFGTGTYFVGNKDGISFGSYKERPQHEVDFDGYNLYKPKTYSEADKIHESLKYLNNNYISSKQELLPVNVLDDLGYGEPDDIINDLRKYNAFDEQGFKVEFGVSADEYIDKQLEIRGVNRFLENATDSVKRKNKNTLKSKESRQMFIKNMSEFLNKPKEEIEKLADDVWREVELSKSDKYYQNLDKTDSPSTRFMKKLGYEGVDVRHIKEMDDTQYGSVIYDLKQPKIETKPQLDRPSEFSIGEKYPPLAKDFAREVPKPARPRIEPVLKAIDKPSDFSVKKPVYPTLDPKFAKERPSVIDKPNVSTLLDDIQKPVDMDDVTFKKFKLDLFGASKDKPVKAVVGGKTVDVIGVKDGVATLSDGTTTRVKNISVPKAKIEPTLKPNVEAKKPSDAKMKFRKTITNSFQKSQLSDEAKIVFDANPREYEVYTNPEQWDKAFDKVSADVDGSIKTFNSKSALENADDTAEGIALMNRLSDADRIDELVDVASDFAERATNAGQAVQAIVMLQKTTPEGKLVQGFNVVNNAKKQLKDEMPALYNKLKKEGKLPEITPEDAKFIVEQMKKAQDLTGRAKVEAIGKVDQLLTDKIPVMFADKMRALRNISLLGNLKTLAMRNPLGNLIFAGLENVSQIPSGLTDKALSAWLKTNRTTKVLPDIGVQLGGLKTGFKDAISDIKLGIDTSPVRGGAELPRSRKVFDESLATKINKLMGEPVKLAKFMEISWLNTANNWLGNALKLGDRPFYQAAYDLRMKELKELMPDADPAELEKIAIEFGKTRTFQNNSQTAQALRSIKNTANKLNVKGFGAGDVVMPFTETPANIMAKGMEYTPLNIAQLGKIALDSKQGGIKANIAANQKQFADAAGRLFTGTGLIALGYTLRKNGHISGKNDSRGKVKDLKKDAGEQRYSIKIGDTWYSYDWAQPSATPIAVGADFFDAGANEEDVLTAIEKGTISGATTLLMQGVTQNLMRMFGGYSPVENLVETLSTAPTQFLPTLGNQTAQMKDEYKRDINYKGSLSEQLSDASKKRVPGLRETLPATLNMWGEPVKEQQGRTGAERAFDIYLNPSLKSSETSDPITKEVNRVYEESKNTGVIPSYTPSALKTSEEIRNFKMIYGPMAKQKLTELFSTSSYKGSKEQSKLVEKLLGNLQDKAKDAYNLKYNTKLR